MTNRTSNKREKGRKVTSDERLVFLLIASRMVVCPFSALAITSRSEHVTALIHPGSKSYRGVRVILLFRKEWTNHS